MLDVYGAVYIDAGIQQFFHIGITLGMPGTGYIGMRQLIHQDQAGLALQDGVNIHLAQLDIVIGELAGRDKFQPVDERLGLGPFMGLDVTHHHIHALPFALVSGFQHGVGLANPGGIAQENLQVAAFLLLLFGLDLGKQFIGIGTGGGGGHGLNILRIGGREERAEKRKKRADVGHA